MRTKNLIFAPSCWLWRHFSSLGVDFHVDSKIGVPGKRLSTVVTCVSSLVPMLLLMILHLALLWKPFPTNAALVFALPGVPALVDVQLDLRLERLWTK